VINRKTKKNLSPIKSKAYYKTLIGHSRS